MITHDDFIGQEFSTPKGGILKILSRHENTSRPYYHVSCSVCNTDTELYPNLFVTEKSNIKSGRIPCGCSQSPKLSSRQREIIISRKCSLEGYKFIKFVDGYKNLKSKFEYICQTHGIQTSTYTNFIHGNARCSECGGSKKKSDEDASNTVVTLCDEVGYKFLGFINGYKNNNSKFKYECPIHGIHTASYNNFVNKNSRCPCCSISGYDQSKPGYFYIFKYQMGNLPVVYKYGITNRNPTKRSGEHIRGLTGVLTKCVYTRKFKDGCIPKKMESNIKSSNKGVCDWLTSGNTETISNIEDIVSVLK